MSQKKWWIIVWMVGGMLWIMENSWSQEMCKLSLEVDETGIKALRWHDQMPPFTVSPPVIRLVVLELMTIEPHEQTASVCAPGSTGMMNYKFEKPDLKNPTVSFNRAKQEWQYTYPWGMVLFSYQVQNQNQLKVKMTLHNQSDQTIANFQVSLLPLNTPQPYEKPHRHYKSYNELPMELGFHKLPFGDYFILLCCEDLQPLQFGFDGDYKNSLTMAIRGGIHMLEYKGVYFHPLGLPRIPPKQSFTVQCSLRIIPKEMPIEKAIPDLIQMVQAWYSPRLVWEDRRPIGAIFLSKGKGPENNPRSWFDNKQIDIRTEDGKKRLREEAMKYADRCINVLKATNAQGMIVWDPEGQENPHPISYIGDPRMVKIMAPEMEDIYPEFFRRFINAGFRVGVCLRPTQVYQKEDGKWAHGTGSHGPERNPLRDDFSHIWPKNLPWWRFFPVVERLSKKVEYAKKNWGCTLFYVDTNGTHHPIGEDLKEFKWHLLDINVWKELWERHPDVLFIPEFSRGELQLAYTSVYLQPPHSRATTSPFVSILLPGTFSVSYTVNLKPEEWDSKKNELLEGIRRGDSMFFRGWFGDHYNKKIRELYDSVYSPGAINSGLPEEYIRLKIK